MPFLGFPLPQAYIARKKASYENDSKGEFEMETRDSIIMTYERILNGEQKTFSPYFFQPQHRKEKVTVLLQYMIEEKLGFTPEEALEKLTMQHMIDWHLQCVLKYIEKPVEFLDEDVRHAVYFAYPDLPRPTEEDLALMVYKDVLEGRRRTFPKNYFLNGELGERRAVICFRHLCEDILKLDKKGIYETFGNTGGLKVLAEYKLKIIMMVLFFSMIDLLETAYPGEFDFES